MQLPDTVAVPFTKHPTVTVLAPPSISVMSTHTVIGVSSLVVTVVSLTDGGLSNGVTSITIVAPTTGVTGSSLSPTSTVYDSTTLFTCPNGYSSNGLLTGVTNQLLRCGPLGTWVIDGTSTPITACQQIPNWCAAATVPVAIPNGVLGAAFNFVCPVGTSDDGTNGRSGQTTIVTCDLTGSWLDNGNQPQCLTINDFCPLILSNGALAANNGQNGAANTFNCDLGFTTAANAITESITCTATGWQDSTNTLFTGCSAQPIWCPALTVADATISPANDQTWLAQVVATCNSGYTGGGQALCQTDRTWTAVTACTDIDECALGIDNCTSSQICTNTVGSFTCTDCNSVTEVPSGNVCICAPGYSGTPCANVDECAAGLLCNTTAGNTCTDITPGFICCDQNGVANTTTSFCDCNPGFEHPPTDLFMCIAITSSSTTSTTTDTSSTTSSTSSTP